MSDTGDLRSLAEAVERAAAAGDFAKAERLLREIAARQEAALGPLHPELAHTLNNLAVVCERTGRPDDAERFYRRARAIAVAMLAPDHPFVSTSEQNLREFCEARGLHVDLPSPTATAAIEPRPAEGMSRAPEGPPRTAPRYATPGAMTGTSRSGRSRLRPAVAALAAGAFVLLLFIATRTWLGSSGQTAGAPAVTNQSVAGRPERASGSATPVPASASGDRAKDAGGTPVSRGVAGTTGSQASAPATAAVREPDRPSMPPAAERAPVRTPPLPSLSPSSPPHVTDAQLCTALSANWQCQPARPPVGRGAIFFFTRIASARDTTVQHRWYAGNRLRQAIDLRIRAGGTRGFRTYSRTTVYPMADDWRVELRTSDGRLLHEERFHVR